MPFILPASLVDGSSAGVVPSPWGENIPWPPTVRSSSTSNSELVRTRGSGSLETKNEKVQMTISTKDDEDDENGDDIGDTRTETGRTRNGHEA